MEKVRWGILGAANIARRNWQAIRLTGNGTVVGVASRDRERGKQFIRECQKQAPMEVEPTAFGSYEELLASKEIDAVYIPLPTGVRKQWVMRAAEAGKHVVCEKPCASSVADLREMIAACRKHNVQFMDGVMFMHSGRLRQMRQMLDNPTRFGPLKRITSAFSFYAPPNFAHENIRANAEMEPHGALGDLGWYCIRLALWATNWELPRWVRGTALNSDELSGKASLPSMEFAGDLYFENGVSSSFYCSFLTAHEQWAILSGHHGSIHLSDFVLPFYGNETTFEMSNTVFDVNGCDFNMEAHCSRLAVPEYSNSHSTAQDTNLFRTFARQVQSGSVNELWPEMALKTQQVLEACAESAKNEGQRTAIE